MTPYKFAGNPRPTLGVEIELNLVDSQSMALRSSAADILNELPANLQDSVKPELLQCYVEINTEVCQDVGEVEADLVHKIEVVNEIAPGMISGSSGGARIRSRPGKNSRSRQTSAITA